MKIQTKHLSNKLPLYYLKTQKAPIVTMQVWVKTGSADELKHEAGLSHFIEHLVFKGTQNYAPGEIAQVVEGAGGELNAYTSFDQTVFYVTVPKENIEVAAKVLHEMVTSPQFDSLEVDREREVVIEEIKRGFDQPSRVASQFLFSTMFKGYAYELPVIGTEENIEKVPVDVIKDYFNERYSVPNMALVCVGDVEQESLEKLCEKYFSKVPEKSEILRDRPRGDLSLSNEKVFYQKTEFEKTFFYYTWRAENLSHRNSNAYEVLALLLGQGESSHLYKDLKLNKQLCQSIGSFYYAGRDVGVFSISGTCMPETFDELSKELPKSVENFLEAKDLTQAFSKARNIFSSEMLYAKESVSSLCRQIGDDWLYYGDVNTSERKLEEILLVDQEEAASVMKSLLSVEPKLTCLSKEEVSFKDLEVSVEKLKALKNKEINWTLKDLDVSTEKIEVETLLEQRSWKTKKNNQVIYTPQTESEVCSIKLAFPGGETLSSDDKQGLVSLFGRVWGRESEMKTEEEQNKILDFYCSSFSAFAGKHSIGLSLMTLNKFFSSLSELFSESLKAPLFKDVTIKREKNILAAQIKSQKDHPAAVLFKSFSQSIFKDTIYSRDAIGLEEHINKLSDLDLKTFLNLHKGNFVLSIVGNLPEKEINDLVESIESALPKREEFSLSGLDFKASSKGEMKNLESNKAQSHIVLGYRGLKYDDSKKEVLDVISSILGGQGGRLFIELRDKESLAYSVAPIDHSGFYAGYFGTYIACDPSKKEKAISMMKEELRKLAQEELSEEELQFAKNQALGGRAMSLQKNSFISDAILFDALYGLDPLNYKKFNESIKAVTADDIQSLLKEILSGEEFLFSIG